LLVGGFGVRGGGVDPPQLGLLSFFGRFVGRGRVA
jgi:hypothetical protein